jgi:prophage regulatory protein
MSTNYDTIQNRFLREKEVRARTGLSRTTRWRLEQAGDFPTRRRLSANAIGWLESEIEAWMQARIEVDAA